MNETDAATKPAFPAEEGMDIGEHPSFDLIKEPWIPVLRGDGAEETVSLIEVFERASEFKEILGDIPTQSFAILRLCLAILHRSVGGPEDEDAWEDLWEAPELPLDGIRGYLNRHRDRFDLFHPSAPFYQVAGLHTARDEVMGLERLIADVPTGDRRLFTNRAGAELRLSAAEAARWLVHVQAYDVSGIKSGAVGDSRVKNGKGYPIGVGWCGQLGGLSVAGEDLRETLLLNLIPRDQPALARFGPGDRPVWEAAPATAEAAPDLSSRPFGPLDLYTWQSRRVRLIGDRSGVSAVLICNGDPMAPQNRFPFEPMTAWRRSANQERQLKQVVYMPRWHDPSRALWRGLNAVLPTAAPRGKADDRPYVTAGTVEWAARVLETKQRVSLHAIGMTYGAQSAVVTDVIDDRLVIPVAVLSGINPALPIMVIDAIAMTDRAVAALRDLSSNLMRAAGAAPELVDGARRRVAERAYAELDGPFRRWLTELDADTEPQAAQVRWHREASSVIAALGEDEVTASGPAAWVGRMVTSRGGARQADTHVNTPLAHRWFRHALHEALPVPDDHPAREAS